MQGPSVTDHSLFKTVTLVDDVICFISTRLGDLFIFNVIFVFMYNASHFLSFLFWHSTGGQPMERNFKACLCTHPQGKPIVHNENPKKSQVSFGSMFDFLLDNWYFCTRSICFVLSVTVKSKGSLVYCFLRGES
jgi:hypothetical protein